MIRRNTRGGKTRVAGPPASLTRPGKLEEEPRSGLEAEAKREKEASSSATTSKAGEKKNTARRGRAGASSLPPAPPSPLPPPPPPPAPALDREETCARGTLMLQPVHPSQRKADALERRRARRAPLLNAVRSASEAEGRARAELDAAALAKNEAERQGRGGSHVRKLEDRRLELEKRHAEAVEKVVEAQKRLAAAYTARKLRLLARGKAAAAESRPPSEDDESDFSDFGEHHWERTPQALVNGRCWVDLARGRLNFAGERQEENTRRNNIVEHSFDLKNTQITPRVPGPLFPGEDEPVPLFPDTFALELAEFPTSQRNVAPDPESASGDLRDALARPEAVEERALGQSSRMRAAEEETTFDLRVVVQQLSAEDLEKFLTGQPVPLPQSPPFVLPTDVDDEEEEAKEEEVKEKGKGKDKEGGKGKQRSAPPAPPSSSSSSSSPPRPPRPPIPPIEIGTFYGRPNDLDVDFYEVTDEQTGARQHAFSFRVQAFREQSTQPRRLAAAAAAAGGSYAPGGPFAKEPLHSMQQATLLLDSAGDFEKVVLALRVAEETEAVRHAVVRALVRRREQAQLPALARMLDSQLRASGRGAVRGLEGGGGQALPPPEPVVVECARLRACRDDVGYLNEQNPVKLMYSLSPAARRAFRGTADRGRGMNPFDLQLPSDWDGRDARGRAVRIPVVAPREQ